MDIVLSTPQELVQDLGEQLVDVPVPQVMEDGLHLVPRAQMYAGAARRCASASDHGGNREESFSGADCEFSSASAHGGNRGESFPGQLAVRTTGTRSESHAGAHCGLPCARSSGLSRS